jgi:hypothetical protein
VLDERCENVYIDRAFPPRASESRAYAGRNAVDGSTSTRWASQKSIDPAWIHVDLGAVAAVSNTRILHVALN